jgi:hypothetical protein
MPVGVLTNSVGMTAMAMTAEVGTTIGTTLGGWGQKRAVSLERSNQTRLSTHSTDSLDFDRSQSTVLSPFHVPRIVCVIHASFHRRQK